MDIQKFCKEIDKLSAKIEAIERLEFDSPNSDTNSLNSQNESNFDFQLNELLLKWTTALKDRYKIIGEIEVDDFQYLVFEVIKKHSSSCGDSLPSTVNKNFENNLRLLEELPCQKRILKQIDANEFSESAEESKIKTYIRNLEKDKTKLTQYKELEYIEFKSLFCDDTKTEEPFNLPPSIDEISKTLLANCAAGAEVSLDNNAQISLLKGHYAGLCEVKVQNILYVLDELESNSEINCHNFRCVLLQNEMLDSENFVRHEAYDEITQHLEDSDTPISQIKTLLEELVSKHWRLFLYKFKTEQSEWDGKQKGYALQEIFNIYFIRKESYIVNEEELQYQITNAIFSGELTGEYLHGMAKKLPETVNVSLKQFLIQKGDELRLEKVKAKFQEIYNYQALQYEAVRQAITAIIDEYGRYCGILDMSIKEKYVRTIRLYIERLDWFVGSKGDGSITERVDLWQNVQREINQFVENPDLNSENKGIGIERILAKQINKKVLSEAQNLPIDILDHLNISGGWSPTHSEFKRNFKTGTVVKLEDLFSIGGNLIEKEWRVVGYKTVIVTSDQGEEYYKLTDDFYSLSRSSDTFNKTLTEFSKEMSGRFRQFKIEKLKSAIIAYNDSKCLENLISVAGNLVFYCSLTDKHAEGDSSFESTIQSFVQIFKKTIEYLLVHQKRDQDFLGQLRIAIDGFSQDVVKYRLSTSEPEKQASLRRVLSDLEELMKTLSTKTYKEPGYQLFTEEEYRFSQLKAKTIPSQGILLQIVNVSIPNALDLRLLFLPDAPEEIFHSFEKLINEGASKKERVPHKDKILEWKHFWEEQQHQIVFRGLVGEEDPNISLERFLEKIRSEECFWERILADVKPHRYKQLSCIMKNFGDKFAKEDLEGLYLALRQNDLGTDALAFSMFILELYGDKMLEDKIQKLTKETLESEKPTVTPFIEKLVQILKAVISNAFKVWEIDQHSNKRKTPEDFIEYLKTLIDCIPISSPSEKSLKTILISLEKIEISFILSILNATGIEESMKIPDKTEDLITNLQLHLQLPERFYNKEKACYKSFLKSLFKRLKVEAGKADQKYEISACIKDITFRYYNIYFGESSDLNETEPKIPSEVKADILEAVRRLYDNLSPAKFIDYGQQLMGHSKTFVQSFVDSVKGLYNKDIRLSNVAITICLGKNTSIADKLISLLPLMYFHEKEHLWALLLFENTDQSTLNCNSNLEEKIEKLLRNSSEFHNTVFNGLSSSPLIMWEEELIALRTKRAENFLINAFSKGNLGQTKVSYFINAFLFFHEQTGHLKQSLFTLHLICQNVSKFETIEQVKQCLLSLARNVDLTDVNTIIKCSVGHQLTLDLLFMQINAENFPKLKYSIEKLKLLLSYRKFEDVSQFCRIFLVHARDQQNLDDICATIELLIECKAYARPEILLDLEDKDISMWRVVLQKVILLDSLKSPLLDGYGTKERKKLVNLLFQLNEAKGNVVQKTVFERINSLQGTGSIKDLLHILHKIINNAIDCKLLDSLQNDLNEWDGILFPQKNTSRSGEPLTLKELLELMKEGDKIQAGGVNETVTPCIINNSEDGKSLIETVIGKARNLGSSKLCSNSKKISDWDESDILKWARTFMDSSVHNEVYSWRSFTNTDTVAELLAVIIRAVALYDHYPTGPRDAQLLAVLLFLDGGDGKGRLGNIYTGEGKTLITVILATCLALMRNVVDVVTSSKVLAVRDSKSREAGSREGYKDFFKMFGLSASNNCDEDCENRDTGEDERKTRYANCQIIYGETGYFQRDILLTKFFRKEIRPGGNSIGHVLVLDEVDSMMIDNAAKTLYISHNITDMSYLRDVFLQIWAGVNSYEERNYSEANVAKIMEYINKIIGNKGSKELQIYVPSTLTDFVERNLKTWVESAYEAKYIGENDAYIIGDSESQQENEIIIMDKDTGVEQTSTKWSNGIHQFIQLKHSRKLSDESLKAVFISNSGYFKMYPKLYGMTGTIGGLEERQLLNQVYGIDFFDVPRFKEYKFEYDLELETVAGSREKWLNNILENVNQTMSQTMDYSREYIDSMAWNFQKEKSSLDKFTLDINALEEGLKILEGERLQCEKLIIICECVRNLTQKIASLCEKVDLCALRENVEEICEKINHLISDSVTIKHDYLKASLEKLHKWVIKLAEKNSEFDVEKFGKDFDVNVGTIHFATWSNEKKAELEIVNEKIKKAKDNLEFLSEAKKKSEVDMDFYSTQSQILAGSKRQDCRRSVLIICENIEDVECIEDWLQRKLQNVGDSSELYKIYKYDRAYRKFELACLGRGDIVIATNIAGRGTDLEVSSEVEANGGLHVILSYVPKNFRIEKQAFGRTARAGNKGTGTYAVFDGRKEWEEETDISQLKTERDEDEARRLGVVLNEQLPKINLEDELFNQFTILQQGIEELLTPTWGKFVPNKDLSLYSKTPLDLQLTSLNNKWALWLNKMGDQISKVNEKGAEGVFNEFSNFRSEVNKKLGQRYGLIDEPGELTKLGRLYLDNKQFSDALACFDHIIKDHPLFSSIAHYYKAFCVVNLNGGGYDAKSKANETLKKSLSLLEDERNRILSRNQILKSINDVSRLGGKATDSNMFAKQNEGLAQVLSVHINAIYSAVGSVTFSDCFIGPGITGDQAQRIYDTLLTKNFMIKNYRISKKCFIGAKHTEKRDENIKEIFLKVDGNLNAIEFPGIFQYCMHRVLEDLSNCLEKSRNNGWWYKDREKIDSSFESMIYTKREFELEMGKFIEVEEIVEINGNIKQKLLGNLNHSIFYGQGELIKNILTSDFLTIDKTILKKKLDNSQISDDIFFGKRSAISDFCLEKTKFIHNWAYVLKNEFLETLKLSVGLTNENSAENDSKFENLISYLEFDLKSTVVSLRQLSEIIKEKSKSLNDENIKGILSHLENYSQLNIDHNFLGKQFDAFKNDSIFLGKRLELRNFCLGVNQIEIDEGKKIKLLHNRAISKDDIVRTLKKITITSESSSHSHQSNFDALLIHLGFSAGQPLQAIKTYKIYYFADSSCMDKIKTFLTTFNLSNTANDEEKLNLIDRLDFGVDYRLGKKSDEIKKVLKSNLEKDSKLSKETFQIEEQTFDILRSILIDAQLIRVSLVNLIKREEKANSNFNPELENILMTMFNENGVITEKDLVLKDSKTGSQELFSRLLDLKILKPPKVYFPLGRATNVPNFLGGNYWKDSSDPAKRIEYITQKIEEVVVEAFKLQRENDIMHECMDYLVGGIGSESKNKELDEKIATITNIMKGLAGTLKIHPEVKLEGKNVRSILSGGRVPPEILEYIHKSFDIVLDYKEHKGFDWDCFLCAMIGVAQIVAGVAVEILSGGTLHFVAQGLISEGIGDIVFAIQSSIEGNFSWKDYSKHKVQSVMLTVLTCGVGSYLARGANVTKNAVGLATKTAIFKAISKTVILEACTAVSTAMVNVGAGEISKLVIDEIANEHFVKYFEKWIREDSSYIQKTKFLENRLNSLYEKFGVEAVSQSVDACLDNSLNQMMTGAMGAKIINKVSSIVGSVNRSFSMAANRFKSCGNSKAKILGEIASLIGKTVKVADCIRNFNQLCVICNDFNDNVIKEIDALEKKLLDQEKNGTLKVNKERIAQEKVQRSFSEETQAVSRKSQEKMRVAFMMKIKNGFLQPAVGAMLHAGVRPIQEVLCAPFSNAMGHLEAHIEGRAEQKSRLIMNQNSNKIVPLTTKQKKALELRGDIIKVDEIEHPGMMKMEFSNFPGETIESLKTMHGSNLSVLVRNGELFAVLPTHRQFCENFNKTKVAGVMHLQMAAMYEERDIEVVNVNVHGKDTLEPHEKLPTTIKSGGQPNSLNSYKMAFIDDLDGVPGHFAPVIFKNGKWYVVSDIGQSGETKDACFAQTMIFLKELEKNGDEGKAKVFATNPQNVDKFNEQLGKFGKNSKRCKEIYLRGTTVTRDRVEGGKVSEITKIEANLKQHELHLSHEINSILIQIDSHQVNSREKTLLRIKLADKLQQLGSDSSVPQDIKDLAKNYFGNTQRINNKHLFDFNAGKVQLVVKKHTKRKLENEGDSRELVEEQWAFLPFSLPQGNNKRIKFMRDIMNALKESYGKNVRMHIINERAGGLGVEDNLIPGSYQLNSVHYHSFEKHVLSFLEKHSSQGGGLLIKTKILYPEGQKVELAKAMHISIGSTNWDVQGDLCNTFGANHNFSANNRRSRRIDYNIAISTNDNTGNASRQNNVEQFTSSSSEYKDWEGYSDS